MIDIKTAVEIGKLISPIAVITAAIWGYVKYFRQRLKYPHADIDLSIDDVLVNSNKRLVHVGIIIKNCGNTLISPEYAELRLRQVIPVPCDIEDIIKNDTDPVPDGKAEITWPMIIGREWNLRGELEIEPGESDTLHSDFIIDNEISTIQLYSFVKNPVKKKPDLGWTKTILFSLSIHKKEEVDDGKKS